ncbi:GNAT family N-acetyltransferase [Hazenella sp. IB182353]|uniref:GNAT family N-acetyltransferase n=1 Tax=Polycladospora coralii TaxID=2771432 RepID=UPI001745FE84|nr:GNAT family protein [Polycladospora coralii]MBS7529992.1 GNAT family N-acetyltransferase [Polycladospora coralii]
MLLGKIVHLKLLMHTDVEKLYRIIQRDPSITSYLIGGLNTLRDYERIVKKTLAEHQAGTVFPFVVIDNRFNQIIGSSRLYNYQAKERTIELGHTWYAPEARGTLVNTECKWLLLQYAFETLNVVRVQIKTDLRNQRAQRAIEKLGAVKEGVLRNERQLDDGYVRDAVIYSIIATEWSEVSENLQARLSQLI